MKNKKGLIILSSVIVVCAVGLVVSPLVNWPVDKNSASGNISKSSRFSRKTADEGLSNMEELMASDPDYKNGIVTAYMVMHTRAQQFSALVDMSNEVAGDIPEYADVIDEMNKVYVTVNNVCASLMRAGENINATLNGEKRPDLAQNTINASLAYTTLQKQNKLATQFIDVTDEYVKNNEASDRLLFVRDQWVDYQLMTAALEGDTKSAEALEKKGSLLTAEKSVSALGSFTMVQQVTVLESACVAHTLDVENSVVKAVPEEVVVKSFTVVGNTGNDQNGDMSAELRNGYISSLSNSIETENFVKAIGWEDGVANHIVVANQAVANQAVANQAVANQAVANQAVANQAVANQAVANQAVANQAVANQAVANQAVANQAVANQAVANQAVANQAVANQAVANQTVVSSYNLVGSHVGNLVSSFGQVANQITVGNMPTVGNVPMGTQLGNFISQTAVGHVANINF